MDPLIPQLRCTQTRGNPHLMNQPGTGLLKALSGLLTTIFLRNYRV